MCFKYTAQQYYGSITQHVLEAMHESAVAAVDVYNNNMRDAKFSSIVCNLYNACCDNEKLFYDVILRNDLCLLEKVYCVLIDVYNVVKNYYMFSCENCFRVCNCYKDAYAPQECVTYSNLLMMIDSIFVNTKCGGDTLCSLVKHGVVNSKEYNKICNILHALNIRRKEVIRIPVLCVVAMCKGVAEFGRLLKVMKMLSRVAGSYNYKTNAIEFAMLDCTPLSNNTQSNDINDIRAMLCCRYVLYNEDRNICCNIASNIISTKFMQHMCTMSNIKDVWRRKYLDY